MRNEVLASQYARVRRPERSQVEMQLMSLDQMLPADHQARIVWQQRDGYFAGAPPAKVDC